MDTLRALFRISGGEFLDEDWMNLKTIGTSLRWTNPTDPSFEVEMLKLFEIGERLGIIDHLVTYCENDQAGKVENQIDRIFLPSTNLTYQKSKKVTSAGENGASLIEEAPKYEILLSEEA